MNRAAKLFPIGLMLAMALLSFWLNVLTQWRSPEQRQLDPSQPEYTIEQLKITRFDEQGLPMQRLNASKMWKLPQTELVHMQQPDLKQFRQGQLDYTLRADQGQYARSTGQGQFDGHVDMLRQPYGEQAAVHLQTPSLLVNSQSGILSNRAPVTIDNGQSRISAVGFYYNHPAGQLKLLSQVRISYAP